MTPWTIGRRGLRAAVAMALLLAASGAPAQFNALRLLGSVNLGGPATAPSPGGASGGDLLQLLSQSLEQIDEPKEIEIGRQLAAVLLGSKPIDADMALQAYVNQLGRWISLHSTRPNLPWAFVVIDDGGYNAFAAPGGFVFVTKGLVDRLRQQLHEVGAGCVAARPWRRGRRNAHRSEQLQRVELGLCAGGEQQCGGQADPGPPVQVRSIGHWADPSAAPAVVGPGAAALGKGGTVWLTREAWLAKVRAWDSFWRSASIWVTAAGLGWALAMSSALRPRMPTVVVATVLPPPAPLPLENRLVRLRRPPVAAWLVPVDAPPAAPGEPTSNRCTQPV